MARKKSDGGRVTPDTPRAPRQRTHAATPHADTAPAGCPHAPRATTPDTSRVTGAPDAPRAAAAPATPQRRRGRPPHQRAASPPPAYDAPVSAPASASSVLRGDDPCPAAWRTVVPLLGAGEHLPLVQQVAALRATQTIYPPQHQLFAALAATPPQQVRVVIVGQDPYHGAGQAHGLAFSVPEGCPPPRSLCNIFKEIQADIYKDALTAPPSPNLTRWAAQGMLLLNTVLSVRAGQPQSHAHLGWQRITTAILRAVAAAHPVAVLLWGKPAQACAPLFAAPPHCVLQAAHPSPLSAHRGFFGCGHFSAVNRWLTAHGLPPVLW